MDIQYSHSNPALIFTAYIIYQSLLSQMAMSQNPTLPKDIAGELMFIPKSYGSSRSRSSSSRSSSCSSSSRR